MIKTQDVESPKINRFPLKTSKILEASGERKHRLARLWKDKFQPCFKDTHHRRRCLAWGHHVQPALGMSRICWCSLKCSVGGWLSGSPTSPSVAGLWCHCLTARRVWAPEQAPHPGKWWEPFGSAEGLQSTDKCELGAGCSPVSPEELVPTGSSRLNSAGRQPCKWLWDILLQWNSYDQTYAPNKCAESDYEATQKERTRKNRQHIKNEPLDRSTGDNVAQHLPP